MEYPTALDTVRELGFDEALYTGDGGSDELNGAAGVGMVPHCAAWFLQRHTSILGPDIVEERSAGYPVLCDPMELIPVIRK